MKLAVLSVTKHLRKSSLERGKAYFGSWFERCWFMVVLLFEACGLISSVVGGVWHREKVPRSPSMSQPL
jgi:hypothetical protein